jgi:hypothetical protein
MKYLLILVTTFFSISFANAQKWKEIKTPIKINPNPISGSQNVFFNKNYTLFDQMTNEPIFPVNKNGVPTFQIYFSSNEDPRPYYGEFTPEKLESHLFYKFKDRESCMKFCDSKWHWSNGEGGRVIVDENNFSNH